MQSRFDFHLFIKKIIYVVCTLVTITQVGQPLIQFFITEFIILIGLEGGEVGGRFNLHFKWLLTKIQNRRQNYLNTIIYILLTELLLCIGQFELGVGRLFFFLRKRELTFQEL